MIESSLLDYCIVELQGRVTICIRLILVTVIYTLINIMFYTTLILSGWEIMYDGNK